MEPIDVRLARIEEGIVHVHSKLDDRHDQFISLMKPMIDRVDKHHLAIAILKRDRKWIYGILAAIAGSMGLAAKVLLHAQ